MLMQRLSLLEYIRKYFLQEACCFLYDNFKISEGFFGGAGAAATSMEFLGTASGRGLRILRIVWPDGVEACFNEVGAGEVERLDETAGLGGSGVLDVGGPGGSACL